MCRKQIDWQKENKLLYVNVECLKMITYSDLVLNFFQSKLVFSQFDRLFKFFMPRYLIYRLSIISQKTYHSLVRFFIGIDRSEFLRYWFPVCEGAGYAAEKPSGQVSDIFIQSVVLGRVGNHYRFPVKCVDFFYLVTWMA